MITESIFDGKKYIIPMAEVCFIDKRLVQHSGNSG